jgi:hypothetical protein
MLNWNRQIKRTAVLVAVVHLLLTASMGGASAEHFTRHGQSAHHSGQHSSLICAWMCVASSTVHTSPLVLNDNFLPYHVKTAVNYYPFLNPLSIFSSHIRPPPVSIA